MISLLNNIFFLGADSTRKRKLNDRSSPSLLSAKVQRYETTNERAVRNESACSETESHVELNKGDKSPISKCIGCLYDKELDKRNYHFGNLLIGELQFVPPCMRSTAYTAILKFVDSLKHQHRNE
jgi:hypothetical protein